MSTEHTYSRWRKIAHQYKRVDTLYQQILFARDYAHSTLREDGLDTMSSRVHFPSPFYPGEMQTFIDAELLPFLDTSTSTLRRCLIKEVPGDRGEELANRLHNTSRRLGELPDKRIRIEPVVVERTADTLAGLALWSAFWELKIDQEHRDIQGMNPDLDLEGNNLAWMFAIPLITSVKSYSLTTEELSVILRLSVKKGMAFIKDRTMCRLREKDRELYEETKQQISTWEYYKEQNFPLEYTIDEAFAERLIALLPRVDLS